MRKAALAAVPAAVLAIGLPFAAKWEGRVNEAHFDRYAQIYDICYGNTRIDGRPVRPGDRRTDAECLDLLRVDWSAAYRDITAEYPALKTAPASVQAMATDLAYNVGAPAIVAATTTSAYLRTGQWRAFCEILPAWKNAGGKPVQGLINRRADAVPLCLSGLKGCQE